ncbi:MAG TPA: GAF domain-containing protein, partial [Mycobacteriales bacterium]|nr:GAF domain-containing protein [Mycobacteriales bacterium]
MTTWTRLPGTRLRLQPTTMFRLALLVLCVVLTVVRSEGRAFPWLVALACAAFAFSIRPLRRRWLIVALGAEAVLVAGATIGTGGSLSPLLPYLLVPAFHAGTFEGVRGAVVPPAAAAAALTAGRFIVDVGDSGRDYTVAAVEWVLLALAVGLIAVWARRLRLTAPSAPADDSYVAAYRLLSQLRTVARQLSAGLDAAALAQSLLNDIRELLPFDNGAVLVRAAGDRLVPLVHSSADPISWEADLSVDSPFAEAWMSQQPFVHARSLTPGASNPATSVVIPLRIGLRTFGLVALERAGRVAASPGDVQRAQRLADEAALRVETALLFNEIREIATVEERRRVAREIHDGIAQELASWGYLVDALVAPNRGTDIGDALTDLRAELTRIISEIRL